MSQNNYTLIEQKERDVYEISNRNADTNESGRVYTVKTLEEAVKKANEIEEKCWLGSSEYGIKISLLNKREINRQEKQEEWKEGLDNIDLMLAMLQSIENCTDEEVRNTAKAIREELDKVSQLLSERTFNKEELEIIAYSVASNATSEDGESLWDKFYDEFTDKYGENNDKLKIGANELIPKLSKLLKEKNG